MLNFFLYVSASLIWGSTWLAIKLQLTQVPPILSVAYRFCLAALILLAYCRLTRKRLKFSSRDHSYMMLQGFTLFGLSYCGSYLATAYMTSGLVAVVFSTILMMEYHQSTNFYAAAGCLASLLRRRPGSHRHLCRVLAGPDLFFRYLRTDRAAHRLCRGLYGIGGQCGQHPSRKRGHTRHSGKCIWNGLWRIAYPVHPFYNRWYAYNGLVHRVIWDRCSI